MNNNEVLNINKKGWDIIADKWFGTTALPQFAPNMPSEDELGIFGNIRGKKVLDIGCGSGHSLAYMGSKGASELWGIDISDAQISNAEKHLNENNYSAKLFRAPMEVNPGIPENYFDIVYSIYAFGWTVDLEKSIQLVSKYLKRDGIFVLSWDHPHTPCLSSKETMITIEKSYHDESLVSLRKDNVEMKLRCWRLSSYINNISNAGMKIEKFVEEVKDEIHNSVPDDIHRYYSKYRAKYVPLSMIIKARKI